MDGTWLGHQDSDLIAEIQNILTKHRSSTTIKALELMDEDDVKIWQKELEARLKSFDFLEPPKYSQMEIGLTEPED